MIDADARVARVLSRLDRHRGSGRSGILWTAGLRTSVQIVQLIGVVILARIVSAGDYGIAAIVLAITGLAFFVNDFGVSAALVAMPRLTDRLLAAGFAINAVLGVILFGMVSGFGPIIAGVYNRPEIQTLLVIGASSFVVNQASMPMGILLRISRFGIVGGIELSGAIAGLSVSWALAAGMGSGATALVVGPVASSAVVNVLAFAIVRANPFCRFGVAELRALLAYSTRVLLFDILNYSALNIDRPLLGLRLTIPDLGLYSRAYSLVSVPSSILSLTVSRNLFSRLANLRGQQSAARSVWLRHFRAAAVFSSLVSAFIACYAAPILSVLLGDRWVGASDYLVVLAPLIPLLTLRATCTPAFRALGGEGRQLLPGVFSLATVILFVSVGGLLGPFFAVGGVTAAGVLSFFFMVSKCLPLVHVTWRPILLALVEGIGASISVILPAWVVRGIFHLQGIGSAVGGLVALGVLALFCALIFGLRQVRGRRVQSLGHKSG